MCKASIKSKEIHFKRQGNILFDAFAEKKKTLKFKYDSIIEQYTQLCFLLNLAKKKQKCKCNSAITLASIHAISFLRDISIETSIMFNDKCKI